MRGIGRRRGGRRPRRRLKVFFMYAGIASLVMLGIILGVIIGTIYSVSKVLPSGGDIAQYRPTEATRIYSSDGELLAEVFEENREVVPISDIPQDLQKATIAIEDSRFYKHMGVDFRGIARAFTENLRAGRFSQGGSTLTQQLARNIYLTREKKLSRKLQEMILALEIERNYSKEQILDLYLNQIYYGSGAYGVQTASKIYFGKSAKDLTLAECALLAGLPRKPSSYSPYEDLDAAVGRRGVVLDRMVSLGYVTQEQCDRAKAEKVKLAGLKPTGFSKYKAPWFVTYVLKQLTDEYGADLIYKGGLEVHTTLNYEMQKVAEEKLRKGIADAKWRKVTQGALVCIDPHTGYIKAMVGGVNPDFTKDQFNRAAQARRQPGSAFKAFVYTAAIDNGYDPDHRELNQRKTYKGWGPEGWTPVNYDGRYGGMTTIRDAVARSINVVAVRVAEKIGVDQIITYAHMLGIKSKIDRNLSIALGSSVVTPLELTSAYGVFAADGLRAEPMAVTKISDGNGGVIKEYKPVTSQVLSRQTAQTMSEMFRGVVTRRGGTGYAAASVRDAHGKTGTTSNNWDAWFVGYTPELVTTVWAGNDNNTPMNRVYGGNVCAPTWAGFMQKALEIRKREEQPDKVQQQPATEYAEPSRRRERRSDTDRPSSSKRITVKICTDSGLLATRSCPSTYSAPFEVGTEPMTTCPIHRGAGSEGNTTPEATSTPVPEAQPLNPTTETPPPADNGRYVTLSICVDSGRIANTYCPETIQRRFRADEVPSRVCGIHRPPRY